MSALDDLRKLEAAMEKHAAWRKTKAADGFRFEAHVDDQSLRCSYMIPMMAIEAPIDKLINDKGRDGFFSFVDALLAEEHRRLRLAARAEAEAVLRDLPNVP